jgi:hypothetical protein
MANYSRLDPEQNSERASDVSEEWKICALKTNIGPGSSKLKLQKIEKKISLCVCF